ncbi:hypothetical protein NPIL_119721 [Nephila pilipes]|uniref:Uncharacterized protein n=1 Tax=Nephila pilipes TaxID=299642 RepID=A0A8X6TQI8_NEPPI|nr:hypothetical protein NPIL_178111 [Nephila pilipes]GFU27511.1 hypothetical protein NPIL_119721 [Nephila pilipes]
MANVTLNILCWDKFFRQGRKRVKMFSSCLYNSVSILQQSMPSSGETREYKSKLCLIISIYLWSLGSKWSSNQVRGGEETYTGRQHREGREEDETDPVYDDGRVFPLCYDVVDPVLSLHAASDVAQFSKDGSQLSVEAPPDGSRRRLVIRP